MCSSRRRLTLCRRKNLVVRQFGYIQGAVDFCIRVYVPPSKDFFLYILFLRLLLIVSSLQNTFAIVNELQNPTQPRMDSVFLGSIGAALCVYCVVAMFGYSTYGDQVEPDILVNYPSKLGKDFLSYVPFSLKLLHFLGNGLTNTGRVFVSLLVAFSYPLQCNPGRKCILNILKSRWNGNEEPTPGVYWLRYNIITVSSRNVFVIDRL